MFYVCSKCNCTIDDTQTEVITIRVPVITENGRDLEEKFVCKTCAPALQDDVQPRYNANNQIQDFLDIIDLKKDPEAFVAMNADFVKYMNEESDIVYPLNPHRVPSVVPDSLESWCKN